MPNWLGQMSCGLFVGLYSNKMGKVAWHRNQDLASESIKSLWWMEFLDPNGMMHYDVGRGLTRKHRGANSFSVYLKHMGLAGCFVCFVSVAFSRHANRSSLFLPPAEDSPWHGRILLCALCLVPHLCPIQTQSLIHSRPASSLSMRMESSSVVASVQVGRHEQLPFRYGSRPSSDRQRQIYTRPY
jgi:hypothetical protein